ncbi:hypothetical protein [Vibrio mediterranei]|uniref:hypothetical protein n=1 Tax=Vibrio mediterranei TaxID=689 RepID=UPI0040678FED
MLDLLNQFDQVSLTVNKIPDTDKMALSISPKGKVPLVITYSLEETEEVEAQIRQYLSTPDDITSVSNIALTKKAPKAQKTSASKPSLPSKQQSATPTPSAAQTTLPQPKQESSVGQEKQFDDLLGSFTL